MTSVLGSRCPEKVLVTPGYELGGVTVDRGEDWVSTFVSCSGVYPQSSGRGLITKLSETVPGNGYS